jgi:hypothetical protein
MVDRLASILDGVILDVVWTARSALPVPAAPVEIVP